MDSRSRLFVVILPLTLWLISVAIFSTIETKTVYACHGNGVSRVCYCGNYCSILESLSYSSPGDNYAWIHADGDVYWSGSWYKWITCSVNNDWRCSALTFADGQFSVFDIYSDHGFQHYGGQVYWGSSETHGQCFPSEWDGC